MDQKEVEVKTIKDNAHALVETFDEYERLKNKEKMFFVDKKEHVVTAASIMRHVRWKLGKLSDQ